MGPSAPPDHDVASMPTAPSQGVCEPLATVVTPIPTVDLGVASGRTNAESADARREELEKLAAACRTCGVFYVSNCGGDDAVIRRAQAAYRAFFEQPLEERMRVAARPGEPGGYEPIDRSRGELNDSFSCVLGVERFADSLGSLVAGTLRWPAEPPDLERVARDTIVALHAVGVDVFRALAATLGLKETFFDGVHGPADVGTLRARRYPPQPAGSDRLGTGAHVDGLPLAIVAQDEVPGLESEVRGVGWATVEHRPGTLVCQLGSLFARWTNDRYVANHHRVINRDPVRSRHSLIYWFPLAATAVIDCLPTCQGPSDPPRYPPIGFLRFVEEWVRSLE